MKKQLHHFLCIILGDLLLINLAFALSVLLKFESFTLLEGLVSDWDLMIILNGVHLAFLMIFDIHRQLWRYAGLKEVLLLLSAVFCSTTTFYLYSLISPAVIGYTFYVIFFLVVSILTVGTRLSYRILGRIIRKLKFYHEAHHTAPHSFKPIRTMLVGAGEAASLIIDDLRTSNTSKRQIIVAVDDKRSKIGSTLGGVPILGPTSHIPTLVKRYQITEIILTMPSASKSRISEILDLCNTTDCKLKIYSGIDDALDQKATSPKLRNVHIEDLLGRDEIRLDNSSLTSFIKGKVILVTGSGGSIGSELCRQIISYHPHKLILLDIYENNVYDLQNELLQRGISPDTFDVVIGSVRDKKKLKDLFKKYQPHMVFHAAAHKHVPLMEHCPEEAVKNNVFGTLNTALLAKEYQVDKFILISTDKAVNPTNVMGATKRLCEMIIQSLACTSTHTEYVAVRFGNVLGSNGSVIPLFRCQLEAGGPLTVTHPDIIRYFMTIPEAVRLILQATTLANGGEIFVLDMGKPVKILDLARNFIRLSGYKEGEDISITFTGLRPGEKLYEELLMAEEGLGKTASDKIFVAQQLAVDFSQLMTQLGVLEHSLGSKDLTKRVLSDIVGTYTIDASQLEDSSILTAPSRLATASSHNQGATA